MESEWLVLNPNDTVRTLFVYYGSGCHALCSRLLLAGSVCVVAVLGDSRVKALDTKPSLTRLAIDELVLLF